MGNIFVEKNMRRFLVGYFVDGYIPSPPRAHTEIVELSDEQLEKMSWEEFEKTLKDQHPCPPHMVTITAISEIPFKT